MGVYLCSKFEVSSIILTGLRQGVILPPPPTPTSKRTPKSPPRLGLKRPQAIKIVKKKIPNVKQISTKSVN